MIDVIAGMRAITVSREYGSGGGEVAVRLAQRLGWQLVDHEVVAAVARKLHVSEAEAEEYDERVESLTTRILKSLRVVQPTLPVPVKVPLLVDSRDFYDARCQVIDGAVEMGHVVIVGRGAQARLGQVRDVLNIRVMAPLEWRTAYVMRREGLGYENAQARVLYKDRQRAEYLETYYQSSPGDSHLYDVVVNTGFLDLESVVDVIYLVLERKAKRLAMATGELRPAVGLPRYPGEPESLV